MFEREGERKGVTVNTKHNVIKCLDHGSGNAQKIYPLKINDNCFNVFYHFGT